MCSLLQVIYTAITLYIYVIIAAAIFSWLVAFNVVNTRNQAVSMIGETLWRLTDPILRQIRRFLPNLGGLDISPIILILVLILIQTLITNNLSSCFGLF